MRAYQKQPAAAFESMLTSFDARRAEALLETDRRMIFELIQEQFGPKRDSLSLSFSATQSAGSASFSSTAASTQGSSQAGSTVQHSSPFFSPQLRNRSFCSSAENDAAFDRFNRIVQQAIRKALAAYSWHI